MSFQMLPPELISYIISELPSKNIEEFSQVSKDSHKIVEAVDETFCQKAKARSELLKFKKKTIKKIVVGSIIIGLTSPLIVTASLIGGISGLLRDCIQGNFHQ